MAVKKKTNNTAKAWEIGAGVTAAVLATAAGAYLLSDKKTKAKAKAWVSKAKTEVAKRAVAAKKIGKAEYGRIVDQMVKRYGSLENITAADVMMAAKELKGEWDHIQAHAKKIGMAMKKPAAKSSARKAPTSSKAKHAIAKKARS
jgi:hypothetical protein